MRIVLSEEQSFALEELVFSTAKGTIMKDQIASFFKNCYQASSLSSDTRETAETTKHSE